MKEGGREGRRKFMRQLGLQHQLTYSTENGQTESKDVSLWKRSVILKRNEETRKTDTPQPNTLAVGVHISFIPRVFLQLKNTTNLTFTPTDIFNV